MPKFKFLKTVYLFILASILCASTQLLHTTIAYKISQEIVPFTDAYESDKNLLNPEMLMSLFGYSFNKKSVLSRPKNLFDGFFRFSVNMNNVKVKEILTQHKILVISGISYTQSVFVRHNGLNNGLQFTFFNSQGHFPVKTNTVQLTNNIQRVSATYIAQDKDKWIRAVDILVLPEADWSYIDIGFPQLEIGVKPSLYQTLYNKNSDSISSFFWWIGIFFIAFLSLVLGFLSLFSHIMRTMISFLYVVLYLFLISSIINLGLLNFITAFPIKEFSFNVNENFIAHAALMITILLNTLNLKKYDFSSILLCIFITFLNQSITAFLLSLFLALILLYLHVKKIYFIFSVLFLLFTFAFLMHFYVNVLGNLFSLKSRFEIWLTAIKIWEIYPFQGIGVNKFEFYYLNYRSLSDLDKEIMHAHNMFLHILVESGILGFAFFFSLFIYILAKVKFKDNLLVFFGVFSIISLNLFDFTFFYAFVHIPFWILIGIGIKRSRFYHCENCAVYEWLNNRTLKENYCTAYETPDKLRIESLKLK